VARAWDTSLLLQIRRDTTLTYLEDQAVTDPVAAPANVIAETVYAWLHGNLDDPRYRRLPGLLARHLDAGTIDVLPMNREAAEVSGAIRAHQPQPPNRRRRGVSKTDWHRNWLTDIHIAATAWAAGYEIQTADVDDFSAIADVIAEITPGAERLSVLPPPPGI
jgi:predicted nucleic acid-binding protein